MPAVDLYPPTSFSKSPFGPFSHSENVTPNDGVDLVNTSCALMALVSGTISVVMADNVTTSQFQITQGQLLPIRVARVRATGTSATGIVALS